MPILKDFKEAEAVCQEKKAGSKANKIHKIRDESILETRNKN
jgi:hypothetical protein